MAGVYISYPFCSQKCTFCNFASGVAAAGEKDAYLARLLDEIRSHDWHWPPETLYFGGGTPSLLEIEHLRTLIGAIPNSDRREMTLECAPGRLDAGIATAWREIGINRVSLGVQSFVDGELRMTGRRHNAAIVQAEVALLRAAGIANINIDLIAGLPGQTTESWNESLDWIERLQPPHVSVYIFEVDEDSRLGNEILIQGNRYGARTLPSEDQAAAFYETAVERLHAIGIERYEVSNFARQGFESAHNLKYWLLQPYVGFGLDAHSFDGVRRWANPDNLPEYLKGKASEQTITDAEEEHFFVGLRLSAGISPNAEERARFAEPIERWTQAGLLSDGDGRLRLTDRGVLLSNEVLQDFVSA